MANMIRKNTYITPEQEAFLQSLKDLKVAEHIRRAIDEYIARKKQEGVSTSPSMRVIML